MRSVLKVLVGTACVVVIAAGAAKAYGAYQDHTRAKQVADDESALRYELTVYAQGRDIFGYCRDMDAVLKTDAANEGVFRPTWERNRVICQHFGYL